MIETDRLILRPWLEADAEAMYRYACDPDIGNAAGWPTHTSVEDSRGYIRTVFSATEIYAVVLKSTGEPIGSCGIMLNGGLPYSPQSPEVEIGYWIGKPYWGKGLIPEAVKAMLNRCFNVLDCNTVWCSFYSGNTKSERVAQKCGFRFHHTDCGVTSPLGDIRTEHYCILTKADFNKSLNPTNPA